MEGISVFCKSYRNDLSRAATLAESVRRFNSDALPFCISVPRSDLLLFRDHIGTGDITWMCDEDIIEANRGISMEGYRSLPGGLSQQIVKAEFWRLNPQPSYLCIDSDSVFIREFGRSDFIAVDSVPYTVIHEGKSFSDFCLANGLAHVIEEHELMKNALRTVFGRRGPSYEFGPFPVAWHRNVWRDLDANHLAPKAMTIVDAITSAPSEAFWYGEALLKYHSIAIFPREPFFRAYLFLEEYEHDRRMGITEAILKKTYSGIVYQSNWHPRRLKLLKKYAYYIKKSLKRFRGR
jgi:hypothetical protein